MATQSISHFYKTPFFSNPLIKPRTISFYKDLTSILRACLTLDMQKVRQTPALWWNLLSTELRSVDKVVSLAEQLRHDRLVYSEEAQSFLAEESALKMQWGTILDTVSKITEQEHEKLLCRYWPLVVRYLETRNGADLIAVNAERFHIHSQIVNDSQCLRTFKNTFLPRRVEAQTRGERNFQRCDRCFLPSNNIAWALQKLEVLIANASNPLPNKESYFNKHEMNRQIDILRQELPNLNGEFEDVAHRYDNLPRLRELFIQAAKQLGHQMINEKGLTEEQVMRQLYIQIGQPPVAGEPIIWMKDNFPYYLKELKEVLSDPNLGDVQRQIEAQNAPVLS